MPHIIIHNTGKKKKTDTQAYVIALNWKPTMLPATHVSTCPN